MPANELIHVLPVSSIKVDPSINQRAEPHTPEYIEELADVLRNGEQFRENPIVYEDRDGVMWLAAGFGRQAAAELAGIETMFYEVRVGERRDALEYAMGDNASHGKRRTGGDVRKAIETAIKDEEWSKLTDADIARMIRCDSSYVSKIRKEITGQQPDPKKQRGAQAANESRRRADNPQEQNEPSTGAGGKRQDRENPDAESSGDPFSSRAGDEAEPVEPPAPIRQLPRDRLGRIIPEHLLPVFNDGDKIREAAKKAKEAKGKAESANRSNVVGGFLRRFPDVLPGLEAAHDSLERCTPFCVCPACDGIGGDDGKPNCPTCGGKGWIHYALFETLHKSMRDHARSFAPGDAWEGDDEPLPPSGPAPAFEPSGPGIDALGRKIPNKLRDLFADEYLPEVAANLKRVAASLKSVSAWNPHLKPIWNELTAAAEHLEGVRPYAVCEKCKGKGCEACLTSGFLPKWMEHELQ